MAAHLANLNGVTDTLTTIPKLTNNIQRTQKRAKINALMAKKAAPHSQQLPLQTTRRLALGLASIALIAGTNNGNGISLAADNGLWRDIPFPEPYLENKIANEKTGTRSFIKKGIYIADIGVAGSIYRLHKYAFDLLAMEDLIGPDTLNYVRRYLRIKSTLMYYDFDKMISAAPVSDKQPLLDLGNRLFDNFEQLEGASRRKNLSDTSSCYKDTKLLLQEVMDKTKTDLGSWYSRVEKIQQKQKD